MKRTLVCLLLMIAICTLTVGCSLFSADEKTFSKAGMTITLTDEFTEQELVTQTAYYVSRKAIVTVLKEDGSTISDYSVAKYAELVCTANKLDPNSVTAKEGYAEFTYEKELNGKDYYYYARCFKNGTDFWLIQFGCETKNAEKFTSSFEKWASSVTFE